MSNQYLSFDVTKQSAPQTLVTGRQGDSQLKNITVSLWDGENDLPYDLTVRKILFEALKPDQTRVIDAADITILDAKNGLFRYQFHDQVFTASGDMIQAFFKIVHEDNGQTITDSTLDFSIKILENRVEQHIKSFDYLSEYDALIKNVEQKFADYEATVKNNVQAAQSLHVEIQTLIEQISKQQVLTFKPTRQSINMPVAVKINDLGDAGTDFKIQKLADSNLSVDLDRYAAIETNSSFIRVRK